MSSHPNKSPRVLILAALNAEGPQTLPELNKLIPTLTADQVRTNASAARTPGYVKTKRDDVTGMNLYSITPEGKKYLKGMLKGQPDSATQPASDTPAGEMPPAKIEPTAPVTEGGGETLAGVVADIQAIGDIAKAYMQDGELILKGVRNMDMLILSQGALIEALHAELERLKNPEDPTAGPYVISSHWIEAEGLLEARNQAIELATSSMVGKAIIARGMKIARVSVDLEDYPSCAATAPCSN